MTQCILTVLPENIYEHFCKVGRAGVTKNISLFFSDLLRIFTVNVRGATHALLVRLFPLARIYGLFLVSTPPTDGVARSPPRRNTNSGVLQALAVLISLDMIYIFANFILSRFF